MKPSPWSRRRAAGLAALLLAVALAVSVRHVPDDPARFHVRVWAGGETAAVIPPGWAVSPWLASRIVSFPAHPPSCYIRLNGLSSSEGAGVFAAGNVSVRPDPDRAGDLVRAFPGGWQGDPEPLASALRGPMASHARGRRLADLLGAEPGSGTAPPLAETARALGLVVESAEGLGFFPEGSRAATGEETPEVKRAGGRRVLLIGLDGADWNIIDPLMRQGRMPNLQGLVSRGVRARLKTITPVLSPIVWTSVATGVGPQKHGIVDFLATSETTGKQIPVTSNMRRVKALWNIVTDAGLRSGVVAWWATWPAEQVDGFIVSDRVAYQLFGFQAEGGGLRNRTYPESLSLVIQPWIVSPSEVEAEEVERFIRGDDVPGIEDGIQRIRTNLASARTYLRVATDLMAAYDPDLKAVYFEGTDTIAHNFMRFRPPAMPGVSPREVEVYGDVVDRYYEYQDGLLAPLLAMAGPDTIVVVCSDHGFKTGSNRPLTDPRIEQGGAADWHRKFGILVMAGPGLKRGVEMEDASVLDVAPTILAMMGLPVAEDLEGQALIEAFEPAIQPARIATYETGGPKQAEQPLGSDLDEAIIEKLEALGYVSQEGSNALNNTGITLMDRGRYVEAAEMFRRALAQQPGFIAARLNLGRAQMLIKDYDAALATFGEVLAADPDQPEVRNLIGNIHMDRGRTDLAEKQFKESLRRSPNDTNALNSLGLLYDKTGRDDLAIEQYLKVVAIDPDYAEGFNNIGLIQRENGQPRKAIEMFERAIQADPDFPGSYNNMGLAYQDQGMLDEAQRQFERGLEVDPNNAVILNNLGTVRLAMDDVAGARGIFEKAVAADPDYPSAHNNLGAVLGMQDLPDEAFEQYLIAVELDPGYADARFNLARSLILQDKPAEAARMLERVLEIDPAYVKAHVQLGLLKARQGDLEGALATARDAVRAAPNAADSHNLLAEVYLRMGGHEKEARQALEKSLSLDGSQQRIREILGRLGAASAP